MITTTGSERYDLRDLGRVACVGSVRHTDHALCTPPRQVGSWNDLSDLSDLSVQINQNLRCTQKPTYTPIFTQHSRS